MENQKAIDAITFRIEQLKKRQELIVKLEQNIARLTTRLELMN